MQLCYVAGVAHVIPRVTYRALIVCGWLEPAGLSPIAAVYM